MRHSFLNLSGAIIMLTSTTVLAACGDSTAPDYTGPVTITISQALTGQTTSAGTFVMTGARADNGSTTEELTFGGPLTTSPVPVTFVRTITGALGTLIMKGSATLTFTSQTSAVLAGTWTVDRGTGAYVNTTGSGSISGTADFGATPPTGNLTYKGSVAR